MTTSNNDFRVRNGIIVAENASIGQSVTVGDDLTVTDVITVNGSGHTINGNTNFGTNTLTINHVNKRAVVNAAATSTATSGTDWAFEVVGKTNIASNLNVVGPVSMANTLSVANNTSLSGNLNVTAANTTITSNTYIQGANIHLNTINGSTTTQYVQVNGKLIVKGKFVSDSGNEYDLDDLNASIGAIAIIKVYDVNGNQVFP